MNFPLIRLTEVWADEVTQWPRVIRIIDDKPIRSSAVKPIADAMSLPEDVVETIEGKHPFVVRERKKLKSSALWKGKGAVVEDDREFVRDPQRIGKLIKPDFVFTNGNDG